MPVRSAGRWIWIGCALLLLFMAAVTLTYVLTREEFSAVFPIAKAGESLIVLAPIANASGDFQSVSRAQSALRREIEAARLGGVRVEIWPDDIQDSSTADRVRSRARASLVIWGTLAESRLVVRLGQSRTSDGTDRLLPGTLVHPPNDFDMTIESTSLEEFRQLALITLGALYLNTDDVGQARAILTQALAYSGARPDTLSALYSLRGYSFHKSGAEGLSQAIEYYTRAIEAVPDAATAYSYRGTAYIKRNMPQEWQRDLEQALAFQPENLMAQQALCAGYALDAQPQAALPLCNAAVRNDSTAISRESRVVVYAQLGRYPEAIEDLKFLLKWLEGQPERLKGRYGTLRANWLTELEAERNPFSERVLEELRKE